jgi:hypothetical protein
MRKLQIPRTKSQGKSQKSNQENGVSRQTLFEDWVLRFTWDLGFGAWDFEPHGIGREAVRPAAVQAEIG